MDVLYLAIAAAFFGLTWVMVRVLSALERRKP